MKCRWQSQSALFLWAESMLVKAHNLQLPEADIALLLSGGWSMAFQSHQIQTILAKEDARLSTLWTTSIFARTVGRNMSVMRTAKSVCWILQMACLSVLSAGCALISWMQAGRYAVSQMHAYTSLKPHECVCAYAGAQCTIYMLLHCLLVLLRLASVLWLCHFGLSCRGNADMLFNSSCQQVAFTA